ncbi:MAG: sulfatase-like hydrolase/transferase [Polyangiaceae bacterium]|nr:sulfatase-like hydrolase/transferase [Polyangiaceae bacterium]
MRRGDAWRAGCRWQACARWVGSAGLLGAIACRGGAPPSGAAGDGGAPARSAGDAGATPERPREEVSLVDRLGGCSVRHRGYSIDAGEPEAAYRRGYTAVSAEARAERAGASVLRVHDARVGWELWIDEALERPTLELRAFVAEPRRARVEIDGRAVGALKLQPGELRVHTSGPLGATLTPGRHRLELVFGRRPSPSVPYAEVDWLRFGHADRLDETYSAPTRRDVVADVALGGRPLRALALRGPSSVRCSVLPARGATLELDAGFWGAGRGVAQVQVLEDGKGPVTLHERRVSGGDGAAWASVSLSLEEWAGRMIEIELSAREATRGGRVVLGEPRVTRPAPLVPARRARVVVLGVLSGLDRRRLPPWGPIGNLAAVGELGRESVGFDHYRTPTSVPASVVATLLTGLPPWEHGLADPFARLPADVPTLAGAVKHASGRAAMFTGVPTSFAAFGFAREWDRFESVSPVVDLPATEPIERAATWLDAELERAAAERVLVVFHARGAHPPWDVPREQAAKLPPEEYAGPVEPRRGAMVLARARSTRRGARRLDDADRARLGALEEAAMVEQSAAVGRLVGVLKRREVWDESLVILTGDAGYPDPPLIPHDPVGTLREDLLSPPLLVKLPGGLGAGTRSAAQATTVDVAPTVLGALGLEPLPGTRGLGLVPAALGHEPLDGRPLVARLGDSLSVRVGSWLASGALGQRLALCQLEVDPACVTDVADRTLVVSRAAWSWTFQGFTAPTATPRPREAAGLDADTSAALTVWGALE